MTQTEVVFNYGKSLGLCEKSVLDVQACQFGKGNATEAFYAIRKVCKCFI